MSGNQKVLVFVFSFLTIQDLEFFFRFIVKLSCLPAVLECKHKCILTYRFSFTVYHIRVHDCSSLNFCLGIGVGFVIYLIVDLLSFGRFIRGDIDQFVIVLHAVNVFCEPANIVCFLKTALFCNVFYVLERKPFR